MTETCRRAITASLVVVLWYPAIASGQTQLLNDLQPLLVQDNVVGDFAGSAVAISGTGNTIAIGVPGFETSAYFNDNEGAVFVFERDQTSGLWSQQARLTASMGGDLPRPQEQFGSAVAISEDGNTLVVGAPLWWSGTNPYVRAFVFHRDGTTWTMSQQLAEGVRSFGSAIALRGSTLVIGAPLGGFPVPAGMAFVYRREPDGWIPTAQLAASDRRWEDDFGASVAVDEDENTIIIGAPGEGNPDDRCPGGGGFPDCRRGAAYVFELDPLNGRWAEQAKLLAPPESARAHHEFGSSVSISAAIAVVGAPGDIHSDSAGSSAAYVFYGPDWQMAATLIPSNRRFGDSVGHAVAVWGRNVLVGMPHSDEACPPSQFGQCDLGSAFLFQLSAGSWIEVAQLAARDAAPARRFGFSMAMVGTHIAIGAPASGNSAGGTVAIGRAYAFRFGPEAPDLVSTAVSDPPSIASVGDTFSATDTVFNMGTTSRSATTRYYFSPDGRKHGLEGYAGAARTTGVLGILRSSTGTRTLTVPSVKAGAYFLIACADETQTNVESNESNNCIASAGTTEVSGADLVEIAIGNPPANITPGGSFAVSDAVANEGNLPAPASITRYYFSLDGVRDSSDELLVLSRTVGPLGPGASSAGTVTVGVPRMPGGSYFLLACADYANVVRETDEVNNCRASYGRTIVWAPDLQVTAISAPPASANLGSTLSVSHTLRNTGNTTAGSSTTRFYLSLDTGIDSTDTLLIGGRQVEGPGAGATWASTTSVQIPSTPTGRYHLVACADDLHTVSEGDESNNCLASATTVTIAGADLVEGSVSNPPQAAVLGSTFTVTDIVRNDGNIASGAFTVRYYLSFDTRADASDARFAQTRTVGSLLVPGASSIGFVTVAVPSMPSGSYLLLACADDADTIVESDEDNNCQPSTTTVIVTGPDLVITALNNVLPIVVPGASLAFIETAANPGDALAAASSTSYYFSANQTRGSADLFIGSRAAGPLGAGASAMAPVSVRVPPIPPGTYYLIACADDTGAVVEKDENNNCRVSATRVVVLWPY